MRARWRDGTVIVEPPKRPRKLTGTRFAAIFGLNAWTTPFQVWCEVTGAWRKPFEETRYTAAGKAIEPKQLAYLREAYGMDDLVDPTMEYGPDPFKATWGDFFPDDHPFGGMWDAIVRDADGAVATVVECKTTKRVEDWVGEGGEVEPPEYYALQAALYAHLLGCDEVVMLVTFLGEGDYDDPEAFVVGPSNTVPFTFSMGERYPSFEADYVEPALRWWDEHVATGESPAYDERRDAEYLRGLRTEEVDVAGDEQVEALLRELREAHAAVEAARASVAEEARRERVAKAQLKAIAEARAKGSRFTELAGEGVTCQLARSTATAIDEDALREDGLWERYAIEREATRFTVSFQEDQERSKS